MFPFGRDVGDQPSVLADVAHSGWDRSFLGAQSQPYTFAIDQNSIERVAWGTCNAPPWLDRSFGNGAPPIRAHAPHMYLWTLLNNTPTYRRYERWVMQDLPAQMAHLHTGDEYRFLEPIMIGDQIALVCRIERIYEKQGRYGRLVFMECRWTYTNQHGRDVATLLSKAVTLYREGTPPQPNPPPTPAAVREIFAGTPATGPGPYSLETGASFVHDWGAVTMKENIRWMAAVDDYATTHYDASYALAHGFPDGRPLLAGPHGGGLMTAAVALWLGEDGWIESFDHVQRQGLGVGERFQLAATVTANKPGRGGIAIDAWLLDEHLGLRHSGTFTATAVSSPPVGAAADSERR
jgi:acyl dehydratase